MDNNDLKQGFSDDSGEFLTFILGGEEYGVDILSVQGIQGWTGVTRVPDTSDHMLGVINLLGAIVPIIDMRLKFKLDTADFNSTTVVIVVRAELDEHEHVLGLVVDAVSEVYKIDSAEIQLNPEFGTEHNSDLVKGLITIEEKMIIVLDVDLLISDWTPETENLDIAA